MGKLTVLLHKINQLLVKIFGSIYGLFSKLLPFKIKNKYNSTSQSISSKKQQALTKLNTKIDKTKSSINEKTQAIKEYDVQDKVNKGTKASMIWLKALNFAKVMAGFSLAFAFLFNSLKTVLAKMNPNFILSTIVVGSFGLVGGIVAFKSSKEIYDQETDKTVAREVSSIPAGRASYYKGERKHVLIADLRVPMYLKNGPKEMKMLRMEFVFETTTRYTKKYIEDHEHEIRDHILNQIEPMSPDFLLQPEGKEIIKARIKILLNDYFKKKDLAGRIRSINVDSMIGG